MTRFRDLVMGETLTFVVSSDSIPDLSATPLTVLLESPPDRVPTQRLTLRWLNGGTDGELIDNNSKVRFTKPPTWTATQLTPGNWTVRILKGTHGTDQVQIGSGIKTVERPDPGPLPTSN